ncbi:hypothetical protein [Mycolicibacterium fortuitum]
MLAIALVVVITVLVVKPDTGTPTGPSNAGRDGTHSEFASANDTGPITIITEDPSCAAWLPITNTLSDASRNGWVHRDPTIPASSWSHEQRSQYEQVGQAMRAAADQTEPLTKLTTHRAMRELYEQFIAYARAYADAIPTYTPSADPLVRAASTATNVITRICQAISSGSAAARAPLVPDGIAVDSVADSAHPERFLTSTDSVCPDWQAASDQFLADIATWLTTDPNIPAGQWSSEQKSVNDAVTPVMRQSADKLEELGNRSENLVLQDLAMLAAQYRRAYAQAIPTYSPADQHLYNVSLKSVGVVIEACNAVAS